ncbi:chromate resistance protein ChrB domain-containing protein [Pararoseomonas indoligenes]|uniref:Chromate resistance protein n=1 Tax=Roseomonas indoligenes TaxID=2820811 RepID=A0A940S575_9PROT|nr:chromate resistance protein ChrB domain-containing protein [Pararoseomonas indoligenes]MBP0492670.1 chromate resistance protein [Pararoseomonas indoligenes]
MNNQSSPEVSAFTVRFGATASDMEDVCWSHRGEGCTVDSMIEAFGLRSEAPSCLAPIMRSTDTGRPDLMPETAGPLAASLRLSRMYRGDLGQLGAALGQYDAFACGSRDLAGWMHHSPAAASDARSETMA